MVKVSIIIPVYNVENFLEKSLESLCCQTLKDVEFICVDDCSTDKSRNILEKYVKEDSRFKLITLNKNKGQGYARNIALKEVKGEYLMFLDPDDWYAENACELAYNEIKNQNVDIVIFNYYMFFEKNGKYKKVNKLKKFEDAKHKDNFTLQDISEPCFTGGSVWEYIYRTSFITENNIKFGENLCGEDNVFYLKAMSLAKNFSLLNEYLYFYRKRKYKNSSSDLAELAFDVLESKKECYEFIKEIKNQKKLTFALNFCINSTIYNYKRYEKLIKNKKMKEKLYIKIQAFFQLIKEDNIINNMNKKWIQYKEFKKIINCNYSKYKILCFLEKIFSISIEQNKIRFFLLNQRISIKYKNK